MELCGVYLNRGRYILTLIFIPLSIILLKIEGLLIAVGQDPDVSHYTQ